MSFDNDSVPTLNEMWTQYATEQSHENSHAMGTDVQPGEKQTLESLPSEIGGHCKNSDHAHGENDLTVYDKMTVIEQTFKTLGGDLEDIKSLMFKLQEVLKSGDKEDKSAFSRRHCFSEESSCEVSVIEEKEVIEDVRRLKHEDEPTLSKSSRESSAESLESSSQYSDLVANIEVLKDKLVSLKRYISE